MQPEIFCIVGVLLDPTAWKIEIYVAFDSLFFLICDVSDGAFVPGCIANFFIDWTFMQFIGAMYRRKSDVQTEIFSQVLAKPLAREREKPL